MPKQKRAFTEGKMNKDYDDRLVPSGQYRDLYNGRVARSEGPNVGAIENLRGNDALSTFIDQAAVVIGSVRHQTTDRIFYFICGAREDGIYEYNERTDSVRVILRSSKGGVLNFQVSGLITGVDLIGEGDELLLFWTDGFRNDDGDFNPPRRINIERMVTRHRGLLDGVEIDATTQERTVTGFTEEEISVVKAPPLTPPSISLTEDDPDDPENEESASIDENLRDKFVRFSYRYKYIDGEYSAFSPYSDVAFSVGKFAYDRISGQITSMENLVRRVDISFNTGPRDVTDVELLYKASNDSIVFEVESFNKADLTWGNNVQLSELNEIEKPIPFSSNKLYRALPSTQSLRVFDAVPLRAETQEVIDNRLVYGNYTDSYDLEWIRKTFILDPNDVTTRIVSNIERVPVNVNLEVDVANNSLNTTSEDVIPDLIPPGENGVANLKSGRDYELGIVYKDNVGRQTPVLSSTNNTVHLGVDRANKINRFQVEINNPAPEFAVGYQFYVKETRMPHYNVIPLDSHVQPDDTAFKWFRISQPDASKLKEGDYLLLKINEHCFTYLDTALEAQSFRIEELGFRERNFLEIETPRIGVVYDTDGSISDPGTEITLQKSGWWFKVRNNPLFGADITSSQESGTSLARSNNARDLKNKPIVGTLANYRDVTYYYEGSNITNASVSEESVTFGGSYTPGLGLHADATGRNWIAVDFGGDLSAFSFGPMESDTTHRPGPMRVEVQIEPNDKYSVAYYLSPNSDEPQVRRGLVTPLGGEDLPATGTVVELFNGVSVEFELAPEDYNIGDKFTCIWRRADNFMWRSYAASEGSPTDDDRQDINSRRAHVMLQPGMFEDGINGNSTISLGLDLVNTRALDGSHDVSLPFGNNEFYTDNVYYDNLEEWIFEEGLWSGGITGKNFSGTDGDGNAFGIHQMGFARGLPTTPGEAFSLDDVLRFVGGTGGAYAASIFAGSLATLAPIFLGVAGAVVLISLFAKNKDTARDFRLASGSANQVLGGELNGTVYSDPVAGSIPLPMHTFIQSGKYNKSNNRMKADHRLEARAGFVQGTGATEEDVTTIPIAFETLPDISALDQQVYYEIGDTFACKNGLHYGDNPNHNQRFEEVAAGVAGTESGVLLQPATVTLDYFNCFAWSNGIESMAIRDEIGTGVLDKGAKASTVLDEYGQRENFANLIYSGPFVTSTGVNALNEFPSNLATVGGIIKEMDESQGTVQHLYAEDTNLYVFQEDKVSVVLVNKDFLYNADGGGNTTATNTFMGQTTPIVGEYGISNNPESFAVYGLEIFWADRNRGSILALQGGRITEISEFGMRDFFRDTLAVNPIVLGSYDDYHDQYIVTMREAFVDPTIALQNIPLILSRQGFLSRNDACRFPENKLQFSEVYEFWQEDEPQGFQIGDIIYNDINRTSIFKGDDDWYVWREELTIIGDAPVTITSENALHIELQSPNNTLNLLAGQAIVLQSNTTTTEYNAVISSQGTINGSFYAIIDGTLDPLDNVANTRYDVEITFKYVINIDNFGVVRRKLDCLTIPALNHDAFRASLQSYSSSQEACALGVVSRILYHDGDDATPDVGDSIYETPYGDDEYIEEYINWRSNFRYSAFDRVVHNDVIWEAVATQSTNAGGDIVFTSTAEAGIEPVVGSTAWTATTIAVEYNKGRTHRQGWLQIFDGSDFEDYVIRILQGKVVEKVRCAAIIANRRTVMIGNRFDRRTTETDDQFATRVCRSIPGNEAFFDGALSFPVIGDTLYTDNYRTTVHAAGFYPITGGFYIQVNASGTISNVVQCVERVCLQDLVNTYGVLDTDGDKIPGIFTTQANTTGTFTFNGVIDEEIYGNRERQAAPQVTVRWSARGSERYPANPNDFYERVYPNGLEPGATVNLTNSDFTTVSNGDASLEYSILEFCYNKTLVPQTIAVSYYRGTTESLSGTTQTATTVPDCTDTTTTPNTIISYPYSNAAYGIASIFDTTGNVCTGTIEVRDEIYFDRTQPQLRFFKEDTLETPLDGTNGITDITLLDSIVVDGITRRGLWWAFGDADNTAADEALLIDSQGRVWDSRSADYPFNIDLFYSPNSEVIACSSQTSIRYHSDNDDFRDATDFRNIDTSAVATGFYTWLDHNDTLADDTDDQRIVRYWNETSETFENRFIDPTDNVTMISVDNCPVVLPGGMFRYSTNEQTLVCSQAPFGQYYLDIRGGIGTGTNFSTGVVGVYTDPFGTAAGATLVPSGFFQNTDGTSWTWNAVTQTTTQNNNPCDSICSDTDASNTGAFGDCSYPTVCVNSSATNFVASPNPKFNTSTTSPICQFAGQGGCTNRLATNYDSNALFDDGSCVTCADLSGREQSRSCSGTTLNVITFTGSGTGNSCGTTVTSTPNSSSCVARGCTDSTAINYDSMASQDDGSCMRCIDVQGDDTGAATTCLGTNSIGTRYTGAGNANGNISNCTTESYTVEANASQCAVTCSPERYVTGSSDTAACSSTSTSVLYSDGSTIYNDSSCTSIVSTLWVRTGPSDPTSQRISNGVLANTFTCVTNPPITSGGIILGSGTPRVPGPLNQNQAYNFSIAPSGGTPPFTYSWGATAGTASPSDGSSTRISFSVPGQFSLDVTVTDSVGVVLRERLTYTIRSTDDFR